MVSFPRLSIELFLSAPEPSSISAAITIPMKNCSPCFKPSLRKRDRCPASSSMSATACLRQVYIGHRFGSLLRAYSLIGYAPDRDYQIHRNQPAHSRVLPWPVGRNCSGPRKCGRIRRLRSRKSSAFNQWRIYRIHRAGALLRDTRQAHFDGKFGLTLGLRRTSRSPFVWIVRTNDLSIITSFQALT